MDSSSAKPKNPTAPLAASKASPSPERPSSSSTTSAPPEPPPSPPSRPPKPPACRSSPPSASSSARRPMAVPRSKPPAKARRSSPCSPPTTSAPPTSPRPQCEVNCHPDRIERSERSGGTCTCLNQPNKTKPRTPSGVRGFLPALQLYGEVTAVEQAYSSVREPSAPVQSCWSAIEFPPGGSARAQPGCRWKPPPGPCRFRSDRTC